ncbi:MAG TPA: helix-turn-helix domain-containing protein [Dermatophilaceae bacterium]|nr:helix-turn-helix domain-containing protein [Dermatophilaceae bacterium]
MATGDTSAGALIRESRQRAGLSQTELAGRAKVTQSVVSAYESGGRQPSLPTLQRLVAASGLELELRVRRPSSALSRLRGPLGRRVRRHRKDIVRLAAAHGAANVRAFGSVARGQDTDNSDVDLLVDLAPQVGLFALSRLEHDLGILLDARVDVVPAADLKPEVAREVLDDAVTL